MSRRIPIGILRQIVICLFGDDSNRQIANQQILSVSHNLVSRIRKKINESGLDESTFREMSDLTLSDFFYGNPPSCTYTPSDVQALIVSNIDYYQEELKRTGVTRLLLWQEFMTNHADSNIIDVGSYQTFCRILAPHLGVKEVTLVNKKPVAGSVLMIDFAGDKLNYMDRATHQNVGCTVFVAVLGYSLYSFVEVLPDARTHNVLRALSNCVRYIGGIPDKLLTDNMGQLVKKADRYEPTFTDVAMQWANHYGIFLSATRVARPRDKNEIERLVNIVYSRIYASLRDQLFYSLEELQAAVKNLLEVHNDKQFSGKDYSRRDIFITDEQPKLNVLPEKDFLLQKLTKSIVSKNCHVLLGEDKSHYSVPYKYIGKRLDILYTADLVEIYDLFKWVATHPRNPVKESCTTDEAHLPPNLKAQLEINSWGKEDYLKMASQFGDNTVRVMEQMFALKKHDSHAYRSCQGLLSLGAKRKFGAIRLERACELAELLNKHSYKEVEQILKNGGDEYFNAVKQLRKKKTVTTTKGKVKDTDI